MGDFKHNSLYERVNKLLVSYNWSDCKFLVCEKEFQAHKLILATSSPVFEAMFYGPLSTNNNIIITDIDPSIFQLLLNFIYTDKVDIKSIEEAYDLLYVSKKYLLDTLTDICLEYVQSAMSVDNVIYILNIPNYMQENKVVASALNLFCRHAYYLLDNYNYDISTSLWRKILESDELNIKERDLIKLLFTWTLCYKEKYKSTTDIYKRRDILIKTGLFSLLRFYALSNDDLDAIANDPSNILLPEEIEHIKFKIGKSENYIKYNDQICASAIPRKTIDIQWRLCLRALIRSESPITIDSHNYCAHTRLKADKSFFLYSLIVQSRVAPVNNFCNSIKIYNEDLIISVLSEDNNSIIKKITFKKDVEYDCNVGIDFSEPLCLRKDQWYTIKFVWPHLSSYDTHLYSVQRREKNLSYMSLCNNIIQFEFEDLPSKCNTGGSLLKGFKFCL
ncbi:unnamed protein product [Leptosia nina]|uniref:BTB domain-containing protein n=1 Tax=Leptosia nina TaxID=320188 RepID=A0AAV1JKV2_9NEOP